MIVRDRQMTLRSFTLGDVYRRNAALFPDRTAFIFEGQRVTHSDYLRRITGLAAGLRGSACEPAIASACCRRIRWRWWT